MGFRVQGLGFRGFGYTTSMMVWILHSETLSEGILEPLGKLLGYFSGHWPVRLRSMWLAK